MLYNRERNWLRGSRGSSLQEAMAGSICAIFIEIVAFIGATWYKTPSMGYSRCPKRPIMNNSTSAPVIWDGQLLPTNMSFLPRKLVTGLTGIPGPWLCLLLWAQNRLFTGFTVSMLPSLPWETQYTREGDKVQMEPGLCSCLQQVAKLWRAKRAWSGQTVHDNHLTLPVKLCSKMHGATVSLRLYYPVRKSSSKSGMQLEAKRGQGLTEVKEGSPFSGLVLSNDIHVLWPLLNDSHSAHIPTQPSEFISYELGISF